MVIPASPPNIDSMTASSRNWPTMSPRPAPMALRMPISRVRSVTVTSMMFITPIPPTSNEIAAIAPSSSVKMPVIDDAASMNDAALLTLKSRVAAVVPCRLSRIASTWLCAASTVSRPTSP